MDEKSLKILKATLIVSVLNMIVTVINIFVK